MVVPFGLMNAPTTFMCLITSVYVVYLGGIVWRTERGTKGNNVIMGWVIVINKVVNPYHVRDHK